MQRVASTAPRVYYQPRRERLQVLKWFNLEPSLGPTADSEFDVGRDDGRGYRRPRVYLPKRRSTEHLLLLLTNAPIAPTAPTGLSGSAVSESEILLAWGAATANPPYVVSYYEVYVGGALRAATTNLQYSVTGLAADTLYEFAVRAVDNQPLSSPFSTTSVRTQGAAPPVAEAAIVATQGAIQFQPNQVGLSMSMQINEGSQLPVAWSFDALPTSIRYRVDSEDAGTELVAWTSLTPATSGTLTIPASANRILDGFNRVERRTLLIEANAGTETAFNVSSTYRVKNMRGKV